MRSLILFTMLLVSSGTHAQFTESMFKKLMEQYQSDPVAFYKTGITPGFLFVAGNGRLYDTEKTVAVYSKYRELPRAFSSLQVKSSVDLAVASGTFTHRLVDRKTGDTLSSPVYFQYHFTNGGNGWLLFSAHHTDLVPAFSEDEPLLRQVIEQQTAAFLRADFAAYQACHSKGPYGTFTYRKGNYSGERLTRALDEYWKTHKAVEASVERSSWSFKVNRYSAYVTFDQTIKRPSGESKSYEIRYLERENGKWKIVGLGVVNPD